MSILIHNRITIQEINYKIPHKIISIATRKEDRPAVAKNNNTISVLYLVFDDVEKTPNTEKTCRLFDDKMANEILDFLAKPPIPHLIICQCEAGISRSSGMAAALGKVFLNDDSFVFDNPMYRPNMTVYRTLLNAGMERARHN